MSITSPQNATSALTPAFESIKNIIQEKGPVTFKEYMALALYGEHGYYQRAAPILGAKGDFITAPSISPLFGQTLARQMIDIAQTLGDDIQIMELGPGTGLLAKQILEELKEQKQTISKYCLVETSRSLTKTQQESLKEFDECIWFDTIPKEAFKGIIIANEFFDALPVHYVQLDDESKEWYVTCEKEQMQFNLRALSSSMLSDKINCLQETLPLPLPYPYNTEFNLEQDKYIKECERALSQGVMIFIDYGFDQAQYYHPTRSMGTLMGHYKHHTTQSPLENPGMQDLTAHVDFTAMTRCAHELGFDLLGYTSQAHFLLGLDILSRVESSNLAQSNALQTLLAPHEMGELIKVIAFGKGYEAPLAGFSLKDFSHLL